MSFRKIQEAYNCSNSKEGMTAIIEVVNERLVGAMFLIQREHMATVGLYHCVLVEGKIVSRSRVMGGDEKTISGFLAGVYLGYGIGVSDA